jgi:acetolactate decarboxylase
VDAGTLGIIKSKKMRNPINKVILFLSILMLYSCQNSTNINQTFTVEFKGALKNMMHKGDISAKAKLKDLKDFKNLYALGATENLKGEIQIFNGEPYNTYVEDGEIKFDKSYSNQATLLVYATVKNWIPVQIPNTIITMDDFENFIEQTAKKHDIDHKRPFPFLVEGIANEISWHVIDWKDGDKEHSHEKHISSGLNGILKNKEVDLLGFYSDSHHAIFTHHTTNMHIHMKLKDEKIAGHVDDLKLGLNMILKLPKN